MHRFFCEELLTRSNIVTLIDKKEIHHLRHVLRLREKDQIILFNEKGEEACGEINAIAPKEVKVTILKISQPPQENISITLACAIPKKGKFEFIIEKATELGVAEIIPLKTKRTEVILTSERKNKKQSRYKLIAINAAKQCKRTNIPLIHPITDFQTAIHTLSPKSTLFIPSLIKERRNFFTALAQHKQIKTLTLFIGPEGDFTPDEYDFALKSGCIPISLGEHTLKVETAAICAISCASLFYAP